MSKWEVDQNQSIAGTCRVIKKHRVGPTMIQLLNRTLKVLSIAVIVSVMAEHAAAEARPDTNRLTCAAAQALVQKHGAIVLGTGPALFDRYVSSAAPCTSGDVTEPAFVPTADNRQCWVGYTCRQRDGDR
jgi:hypothetical protein